MNNSKHNPTARIISRYLLGIVAGTLSLFVAAAFILPQPHASMLAAAGSERSSLERAALFTFNALQGLFGNAAASSGNPSVPNTPSPSAASVPAASANTPAASPVVQSVLERIERIAPITNQYFTITGVSAEYVNERISTVLDSLVRHRTFSSSSGGSSGTVTSIAIDGGTTGLSFSGSPISESGTFALSGILGVGSGGTGVATVPVYGQLLVGDGSGGYALLATSSLGISGSSGASFSYLFPNNATTTLLSFAGGASTTQVSATAAYFGGTATSSFSSTGVLTLAAALTAANGGTGSTTLGGLLTGNGTGALTSATVSGPLVFSGNTLSITQANGSTNGYLTSADWTFFNSKVSSSSLTALNYASYPFTLTGNATSTLTQFNGGLTAYASSTIGNGIAGLTISGTGTTTGNAYFGGNVGVGTTSPGSLLSLLNLANFTTGTSTFYSSGGLNLAGGCFAIGGICVGGSSGSSFSYLFPNSATTTSLGFYASTTIGNGILGLTISGNATTTGNAYFVGNVGIGTTSPSGTLGVAGNLFVGNAGSASSTFTGNVEVQGALKVGTGSIYLNGNSTSTFSNGATFATTGGFVGIGTSSPYVLLSVAGSAAFDGTIIANTITGTSTLYLGTAATTTNIVLNTLGSGSVAGLIAPNVAPSGAAFTRTISTLDTTSNTGNFTSVVVPADGKPFIIFVQVTNSYMYALKCGNSACTSGNTTTLISTSAFSPGQTSVAIGTDGYPVFAFNYNSTLAVTKCSDATCSSFSTNYPSGAGYSGMSVAIGADGYPVIATVDGSYNLKVVKCSNASCSSSTAITLGDVVDYTAIAIGADTFPFIVADIHNSGLKVIKCGNTSCTSGNATTTIDSTGDTGWRPSVLISPDTFPLISYYDTINADLIVLKCGNTSCSSGNTSTAVDSVGDVGQYTSMTSSTTDSLPVIGYYDSTNADLKVFKCSTASCTGGTAVTVDSTGSVGNYPSIAIGTDGYPVLSYEYATSLDLKFVKCGNKTCSPSGTDYSSYGIDLGSTSKFFRNIYAANIYARSSTLSGFDVAEAYPTKDGDLGQGLLVSVDTENGGYVKTAERGERLLGVVSTAPGLLLSDAETSFGGEQAYVGERKVPVALVGRVPVSINGEGGAVQSGDAIALSSTPGVGRKAVFGDATVGYALEDADVSADEIRTIAVFVSPGYETDFNSVFSLSTSTASSTENGTSTPKSIAFIIPNFLNGLIAWLANAANGIGTIVANTFSAKEKICVDDQCLTKDDVQVLLEYAHDHGSAGAAGSMGTSEATGTSTPPGDGSVGGSTGTSTPPAGDTVPPIVSLNGEAALEMPQGSAFTDPGATALDDMDGDLTASITLSGVLDTAIIGTYTLTYSVADGAGNVGSVSRVITVISNLAP